MVSRPAKMSLRQKITLVVFLLIGTTIQIIPTVRSGLLYSYGIGFWGPSGHDSVWHLSLINHLSNPWLISLPIFAGEKLINYHPFFDILISLLSKTTGLSSSLWLFQLFPFISSLVFLYLSFILGQKITKKFSGGLILLALNTLANSFGWLVSFIRFGNFSGESIFWAMQSPSNQINPPYILSLIFLEIFLLVLLDHRHKPSLSPKGYLVVLIVLILLPITKAYSAVAAFGLFGLYSLFTLFKHHSFKNILFLAFSFIASIIIFLHYNPQTNSLFVFQPFWFINSMIESPDRVYLPHLANIRYSGFQTHNYFKLFFAISLSFIIFILGNFAWRLLGLLSIFKKIDFFKISLAINILLLTLIPTFFIQTGTGWNTIQFLYYALFLSNFLLTSYLVGTRRPLIILIFATYIVAFLGNLGNYTGKIPPAYLPAGELTALQFLSLQPSGIVLTAPYDPYLKKSFPAAPVPLYAYETTAYVSAYSHQLTFLEDEMNLNNSGYDYLFRRKQSDTFFLQKNIFQDRGFLVNHQIKYIYLAGKQQQIYHLDIANLYLTQIFQSPEAAIYRVQR